MKGLKNYNLKFEKIKIQNIHIKTKHVPGEIGDSRRLYVTLGDLNITQTLPGYTYPPNILCAAFQMQYHKPNGLWIPKEWNNTTQIYWMKR